MYVKRKADMNYLVDNLLMRFYIAISNAFLKTANPDLEKIGLKELFLLSLNFWIFIRTKFIIENNTPKEKELFNKLEQTFFNSSALNTFNNLEEAKDIIKTLIEASGYKQIFLDFKMELHDYETFGRKEVESNEHK